MVLLFFFIIVLFNSEKMTNYNRLIKEKSPYLLQHSKNPVNWFPWGEEAFKKAKEEDKPIFLSIGYSTCHWCHIMEEESFSNEEIAEILNKYFISIKVDREEMPDVDNFYMKAVYAMTGNGGWPLTVFLTPQKEPFFGGTYFPPDDKQGMIGLKKTLTSIAFSWKNKREVIFEVAKSLIETLKEREIKSEKGFKLNEEILKKGFKELLQNYDSLYFGFGISPKFPIAHNLYFLLRYWKRTGEEEALEMVLKTLNSISSGGIYDQLGGGFHRYSTDRFWHTPHFEKMLYDQALLAKVYLEAYQVTKNEEYKKIASQTLDFVLREMESPEGGFFTAFDADSPLRENSKEKGEGEFYLWKKDEILNLLGKGEGEIFSFYYGVSGEGKNILYIAHKIEETAEKFNIPSKKVEEILKEGKEKLLKARALRPKPFLDEKILVDWNGLMISSLAFASRVLNEKKYLKAAINSANFIIKNMLKKDFKLLHSSTGKDGKIDDYAFFILGLLNLYEATFNFDYFILAKKLQDEMIKNFWDEKDGGFFFSSNYEKNLPSNFKEIYDGSIPSGNSVSALNLIKIGKLTMNDFYIEKALKIFDNFSKEILNYPSQYTKILCAIDFILGPSYEIIISGKAEEEKAKEMIKEISSVFLPNKIIALNPFENEENEIFKEIPILKDKKKIKGETTIYVCKNFTCKLPTTDIKEMLEYFGIKK